MDPKDTEHVKRFEEALERWQDARFLTREDLRTLAMFNLYLVNLAEHDGWAYLGHSWRESSSLGCLVVRGLVGDVPSVVFTNAATSTASMRIFLRKLEAGFLEWVPDKYAR